MNKSAWAAILVLLLVFGMGLSSPPCVGVGFRAAKVGAAAAVIGSGVSTLPAGRTCISIAQSGNNGISMVYIATFDRTGAIEDSTTLPIPVGGSFEKYFRDGVDSLEVKTIASGDTLAIEVSS